MFVETALWHRLRWPWARWGLKRKPSASPPDFSRLQAQMMHARNMGMRMNELASSEVKLERERLELERLMALKEEVQWLLETVETMIQRPDPNRYDMLEQLLDPRQIASSLAQLWTSPHPAMAQFCNGLQHLHNTLCLAREIHHAPPSKMNCKTLKKNMIQ